MYKQSEFMTKSSDYLVILYHKGVSFELH